MRERLSQFFRLREGEGGLVLALGVLLLCNSIAIQVSNVVSISGFLDAAGVQQIPFVWIVDMLVIMVATGLQSLVVDRFERLSFMRAMTFGFALIYITLRLMFTLHVPEWVNYFLLYVLTDVQWLFFPLVFWVMANDICDPAQGKRLFPLIAAFAFAGKLLGLGISVVSPRLFERLGVDPAEILSLNVLIYLLAYLAATLGLHRVRVRQTAVQPEKWQAALSEGWGFVKEVLSFRFLMISMLALAVCDTIIEFNFLAISEQAFTGLNRYQEFYGTFKLGVTVASILIQTLLTSRFIERFGLKNSFLVMPVFMLLSMLSMVGFPGIVSAIVAMGLFKLNDGTIEETARKSFQALVPEERRGRVSMFMDSFLLAGGTILGSLVIAAILYLGPALRIANLFYAYLLVGTAAALISIWAIFRMRREYDSSLFNWRLKRRQRGASVLDKLEF